MYGFRITSAGSHMWEVGSSNKESKIIQLRRKKRFGIIFGFENNRDWQVVLVYPQQCLVVGCNMTLACRTKKQFQERVETVSQTRITYISSKLIRKSPMFQLPSFYPISYWVLHLLLLRGDFSTLIACRYYIKLYIHLLFNIRSQSIYNRLTASSSTTTADKVPFLFSFYKIRKLQGTDFSFYNFFSFLTSSPLLQRTEGKMNFLSLILLDIVLPLAD